MFLPMKVIQKLFTTWKKYLVASTHRGGQASSKTL
jgi:hypothetical protein